MLSMLQKNIEETLLNKSIREDKFGNEYLLLTLNNDEKIFVFSNKIKKPEWDKLKEGSKYEFTIDEKDNRYNLLVSFSPLEKSFEEEFFI